MDTGASRLRVTPHEFMHHVRPALMNRGFTEHQINQVETAFHASLLGDPDHPSWKAGIDQKVKDQTIGYMKQHPATMQLGPKHWEVVDEVLQHSINHRE